MQAQLVGEAQEEAMLHVRRPRTLTDMYLAKDDARDHRHHREEVAEVLAEMEGGKVGHNGNVKRDRWCKEDLGRRLNNWMPRWMITGVQVKRPLRRSKMEGLGAPAMETGMMGQEVPISIVPRRTI